MNTQETVKHTAAPWTAISNENDNGFKIRAMEEPEETCVAICQDAPHMEGGERYEAEANANLIAAAPEMLEALKEAVKSYQADGTLQNWPNILAAIGKAEGRA